MAFERFITAYSPTNEGTQRTKLTAENFPPAPHSFTRPTERISEVSYDGDLNRFEDEMIFDDRFFLAD